MSDRDKKIVMVLAPLVLLGAFWFLLLSPKRAEVSKLGDDVAAAQTTRDDAVNKASSLEGSRENYAKDYATVVRLGKAVPSSLDMPSLLVQLDSAAKGTGSDFKSVKTGERSTAATPAPAASSSSGSSAPPVAAGGEQAQSSAGQSAEKANNAGAQSDQANQAATQEPSASGSAGSTSSGTAAPAAGGTSTTPATGTSGVAGLDSVPLDFTFTGSYFDLADFFHRMKRFVRVANEDIKVRGRLMTIDNLDFTSTSFPTITANVKATVYLTPKTEGTSAGGTPAGPEGSTTPATGSTPAATGSGATTPAPASSASPAAGGQ